MSFDDDLADHAAGGGMGSATESLPDLLIPHARVQVIGTHSDIRQRMPAHAAIGVADALRNAQAVHRTDLSSMVAPSISSEVLSSIERTAAESTSAVLVYCAGQFVLDGDAGPCIRTGGLISLSRICAVLDSSRAPLRAMLLDCFTDRSQVSALAEAVSDEFAGHSTLEALAAVTDWRTAEAEPWNLLSGTLANTLRHGAPPEQVFITLADIHRQLRDTWVNHLRLRGTRIRVVDGLKRPTRFRLAVNPPYRPAATGPQDRRKQDPGGFSMVDGAEDDDASIRRPGEPRARRVSPGRDSSKARIPNGELLPRSTTGIDERRRSDVCCVNTRLVEASAGEDVRPPTSLRPGSGYRLLVNIGPHDPLSLVLEPEGRWPAEHLPRTHLALRVIVQLDVAAEPMVRNLTLPSAGASTACNCGPTHTTGCPRPPWVEFPVTAPAEERDITGVLAIYYQNVVVYAQELILPVRRFDTLYCARARLLYRLTARFDDLGPLADRTASVFVPDTGGRAIVNALPFVDNPVSINANAADNAARAARKLLYEQHLELTRRGPRSRADADYRKPYDEYVRDLANLARLGWTIYNRLFTNNTVFDTLPDLIRHEALARNHPAIMNITDTGATDPDRARTSVPWSLVYDLPMPQHPDAPFRICRSVRAFGPGRTGDTIPPHCPEPDHNGNILCPFGFWGLSCVLEQPPRAGEPTYHVFAESSPLAMMVAVDERLHPDHTRTHLAELRSLMTDDALHIHPVRSAEELARALAPESMDVAYLYCHGGYHQHVANESPSAVLCFGDTFVSPEDIAGWRRYGGAWPYPHWPRRKPVVVLNGCNTTEFTTTSLSNFVDAFISRAGAAAVVGTEIALEQSVAGWASRNLLSLLLADGDGVGPAIRELRWRLIARGNTVGLAYTLHGIANLRLRQHHPKPQKEQA